MRSPPRRPELIGAALCALALALLLWGCGGTRGAGATPTTAPQASTGSDEAPQRDLFDLARRLRGLPDLPRDVQLPAPAPGEVEQFQVLELPGDPKQLPQRRTTSATLRATSEHAYFFFDTSANVSQQEVDAAVSAFEGEVWPKVTGAFGLPPSPGVDGDPRIYILETDLGATVAGYESDEDAYRKEAAPYSNQHEMLYLNIGIRPLGSPDYKHVLAHEFQHLVHRRYDEGEDTWVNEGLSEVAGALLNGGSAFHSAFLDHPDTQLTAWTDLADSGAHYGSASLFVHYLLEQTGAPPSLLVSQPEDSVAGVEAFLRAAGSGRTFEQVVTDWTVANLLDEPSGPYGYHDLRLAEPSTTVLDQPGSATADVHQFAADYLELRGDNFPAGATLTFTGSTRTPPVAAQAGASGAFWWSGQGDNIDSTLTRELDLTAVQHATLTFRTWFDIEKWFDWGQLAVSRDGGKTWTALAGQDTTTDDPMGVGYGPGYDGRSGGGSAPQWVNERVDLSAYAGSKILVRFEVLTDDSNNLPGWAIDDIAVPETGFHDDAEADIGGWQRAGWRRVSAPLQQRFELRLVTFGSTPEVTAVPLDAQNRATVDVSGLGTKYGKAVIVVVGVTDGTVEPATYQYAVAALSP